MRYTALKDLPTGFAFQCNSLEVIDIQHSSIENIGDCKYPMTESLMHDIKNQRQTKTSTFQLYLLIYLTLV